VNPNDARSSAFTAVLEDVKKTLPSVVTVASWPYTSRLCCIGMPHTTLVATSGLT
jgi:hypothetical protein